MPTVLEAALARLRAKPAYSACMAVSNALKGLSPADTGLAPVRLALLSNFTAATLVPVVEAELALAGFHPMLYLGDYNAIARDALNSQSGFYRFAPDFILVAEWLETISPALVTRFVTLASGGARDEVQRVRTARAEILEALRRHTSAPVLINNFPLPRYPSLGILDAQSDSYQTHAVLQLNLCLVEEARRWPDVYIVDFMGLAARIGSDHAIDERYWQIGRAPIGQAALPAFGREFAKFVGALRGRTRKCLVLDCDNTLWGGIVGEVGARGIQIDSSYPGSCYRTFQQEILNLYDRGVILALCSKNNEADVTEVLRDHPEMLLREHHFAAREINWNDKAGNLRNIAASLNIGLDSLVFVDDNLFECNMIRELLPQVEVLHLDGDPSTFAGRLCAAAYFDSLTLSAEDGARTRLYHDEAERRQLQAAAGSLEEYLARLELVAELGPANDRTLARVAQLTQKTNQFNLTTRRYSEGEVRALAAEPDSAVYHLKLRDRVAELGLVGVAIVKYRGDEAEIDTFLLSCRALGRGAEQCLLVFVTEVARQRGCHRVVGRYVRTAKNAQTADFYPTHGFQEVVRGADESEWSICLSNTRIETPAWIKVEIEDNHVGE